VPLYENEGKKTEKFILTVSPDQLKAVLTLTGDAITQAVSPVTPQKCDKKTNPTGSPNSTSICREITKLAERLQLWNRL